MNVLNKKYTLLEGENVIKCEWEDHTIYFTRLTAANSLARLFMLNGGEDGEYSCWVDDIMVTKCDDLNQVTSGILVSFRFEEEDKGNKTLNLLVDFPYGTFVSEWY